MNDIEQSGVFEQPQQTGYQSDFGAAQVVTKENVVAGIVGAFLGSLIGVVVTILVSQLGYVAAICGVVMAICTVMGYERFSGKLGITGMVVCSIIIILMTYMAVRIDWSIELYREIKSEGYTFFESYRLLPVILEDPDVKSSFMGSLGLTALFTLIGAVPTMFKTYKTQA